MPTLRKKIRLYTCISEKRGVLGPRKLWNFGEDNVLMGYF